MTNFQIIVKKIIQDRKIFFNVYSISIDHKLIVSLARILSTSKDNIDFYSFYLQHIL